MKMKRETLLSRLLLVEPGLTGSETIVQSSCVIARRGRFYTLNQEVACSIESGFDKAWDAAFRADKLIAMLKSLPDEEVNVEVSSDCIRVKANRRNVKFPLEAQSLLPVDAVEKPGKGSWVPLSPNFTESVDVVSRCAAKSGVYIQTCIHICPDYVEASDNQRIIRYKVPTFVKKPVLVLASSLACLKEVEPTHACETEGWLHFWNDSMLRLSVHKGLPREFPVFDDILAMTGTVIKFPAEIKDVAQRAGIVADQDKGILLKFQKNTVTVIGESINGEYTEEIDIAYSGPPLSFYVRPPKMIADVLKKETVCELCDGALKLSGANYTFMASLENG
jgi:hypothetical protein